ncbi:MAG: KamA family radical SAM protein [Victivallales bacterium]|nr:KamA family radical SAM protein [Victivallales bacterium]
MSPTPRQWQDWHWQLANSPRSLEELATALRWSPEQTAPLAASARRYRPIVTPFYLSLARSTAPNDPILKQCLPSPAELTDAEASLDPLFEGGQSVLPRMVHRYRDRVLFFATGACALHCRHCMRKRFWDGPCLPPPTDEELDSAVTYLHAHPEVREILVSGGDPLVLEDQALQRILAALCSVPTIEMLRIGTRCLAALPQRVTPALCAMLENCGKTVWVAAHFNHPDELSQEAGQAVLALMKSGVPTVNQTVLLKGVNDAPETLRRLFTGLLKMRVKPYYLYHGDPVRGTTCFRTGVKAGLDILAEFRSQVSGMAVPAYSFDLPEGGGKIRLEPDFQIGQEADGTPIYQKIDGHPVAYR